MSKSSLLVIISIIAAFVIGSAMTLVNVFPATVVKRSLQSVGIGREAPRPAFTNPIEGDVNDTSQQGTIKEEGVTFKSSKLGAEIDILPGVFNPYEAERTVLVIMENNRELFEGKRVMEIGTGSGIISLYAAKLGAAKVVATDINPAAIKTATQNAAKLGFADIMEPRLVTLDDISAYAVIGEDESFDVIISNPPYALDLDASGNDAVTDTGELGFSIVRGLKQHLNPDGTVILWCNSLFYHAVMAKFAAHEGYTVRNHLPNGMFPWAAEALFNSYLKRWLISENMSPDAFQFDYSKDLALDSAYLRNQGLEPYAVGYEPLFPENTKQRRRYYAGTIVIEHSEETLK
ncbi:MAG: 50S ribosomal protein L11 methyltransferase [Gammaproteobacteria bacterium]